MHFLLINFITFIYIKYNFHHIDNFYFISSFIISSILIIKIFNIRLYENPNQYHALTHAEILSITETINYFNKNTSHGINNLLNISDLKKDIDHFRHSLNDYKIFMDNIKNEIESINNTNSILLTTFGKQIDLINNSNKSFKSSIDLMDSLFNSFNINIDNYIDVFNNQIKTIHHSKSEIHDSLVRENEFINKIIDANENNIKNIIIKLNSLMSQIFSDINNGMDKSIKIMNNNYNNANNAISEINDNFNKNIISSKSYLNAKINELNDILNNNTRSMKNHVDFVIEVQNKYISSVDNVFLNTNKLISTSNNLIDKNLSSINININNTINQFNELEFILNRFVNQSKKSISEIANGEKKISNSIYSIRYATDKFNNQIAKISETSSLQKSLFNNIVNYQFEILQTSINRFDKFESRMIESFKKLPLNSSGKIDPNTSLAINIFNSIAELYNSANSIIHKFANVVDIKVIKNIHNENNIFKYANDIKEMKELYMKDKKLMNMVNDYQYKFGILISTLMNHPNLESTSSTIHSSELGNLYATISIVINS